MEPWPLEGLGRFLEGPAGKVLNSFFKGGFCRKPQEPWQTSCMKACKASAQRLSIDETCGISIVETRHAGTMRSS